MKRQLTIDLADLVEAFESSSPEMSHYLDLESGEVILATGDMRSAYEQMVSDAEAAGQDFATALAASEMTEWEKDDLALMERVEEGFGDTVTFIPNDESSDAFADMEAFADTVTNPRLRERLFSALSAGRPFRRFKDAIDADRNERERWFTFKDARLRARVLEWLEEEGIEAAE